MIFLPVMKDDCIGKWKIKMLTNQNKNKEPMQTSYALAGGGDLKAFLRTWEVNLCVEGKGEKKQKQINSSLSKQTDSKMVEEREPHCMGP